MKSIYRNLIPFIALIFGFASIANSGTITASYGTSNQTITITLASLGASATVCRQSTAIDNTSNLYLDVIVTGLVETGTVSGNKQVVIYAAGTSDGGTTYDGKNGSNTIGASDASFTRADPTTLPIVKVVPVPTNSTIYSYVFSAAQAFGGFLPDHFVFVVCNDSGAALSATAGNNKMFYQGIKAAN